MLRFRVFRIDDPSKWYTYDEELIANCLDLSGSDMTFSSLRQRVAAKWGIPAGRHRYYGYSKSEERRDGSGQWKCRFDTEILRDIDDGNLVCAKLRDLERRRHILSDWTIAVVFLPAEEGANPVNGDEVEVDRVVDTLAEPIEAGRATAKVIADNSDDDSEERPPAANRARRVTEEDEAEEEEVATGGGGEDHFAEDHHTASASSTDGSARGGDNETALEADATTGETEEEADPAEDGEDRRDGAGGNGTEAEQPEAMASGEEGQLEEDGTTGAPAPAPAADTSGDGEAATMAAVAADDYAPPQSLRQWLSSIDTNGTSEGGRFERYIAAFEREFENLEDVVLIADNPRYGVESILQKCGVERLGDKGRIERAIGRLPRPE